MNNSPITQYGAIILAAFLINQVAIPNLDIVQKQFEERESLLDSLGQAQKIQTKRDSILSYYNEINTNIQRSIQNAIPVYSNTNVAQFLVDLNKLRQANGLPIDTVISISKEENSLIDGTIAVPITMKISTTYANFNLFLENLQKWSRGIRIKNISMSSGSDSEEASSSLNITIEFDALFTRNET